MAAQQISLSRDVGGNTVVTTVNFDAVTFLVASIAVINNQNRSYTWLATNGTLTDTKTVPPNSSDTHLALVSLTLNTDLTLPGGWTFAG